MRRTCQILLVTSISLLVGSAGAEGLLRILASLDRPQRTKTHTSDPILHHRLRASVTASVHGVEFQTNSLGLHDREYPKRKPTGVFRVLLLGDSFTEGGGLPLEATVAKQMEVMLNARDCGRRFEVVNGGTASYSPILEYLFLRDVGLGLEPDLVVLNFDMTDVHDDFIRTAVARLDPDGLPLSVPSDRRLEAALLLPPIAKPTALRFLDPVERRANRLIVYQRLRHSRLGQWFFGPTRLTPERLEKLGLVGDIRYDPMAITRHTQGPEVGEAWRLTERYLAGVHRLARQRGRPFAVVVYPHPHQVAADASLGGRLRFSLPPGLFAAETPFQRIEALCRREGVPIINLLHHFRRRHAAEGPLYWDDDVHHNPRGARVFAEGAVAGMHELGLVPCRPGVPHG